MERGAPHAGSSSRKKKKKQPEAVPHREKLIPRGHGREGTSLRRDGHCPCILGSIKQREALSKHHWHSLATFNFPSALTGQGAPAPPGPQASPEPPGPAQPAAPTSPAPQPGVPGGSARPGRCRAGSGCSKPGRWATMSLLMAVAQMETNSPVVVRAGRQRSE